MAQPDDFRDQWRERLASGSKLAARALSTAIKEDPRRVGAIAPLTRDVLPTVRVAAYRALEEVAAWKPLAVAPYAQDVVAGLAAPEPDAQAAALAALTHIAPHAQPEAALALPLVADLLKARRPALREEAARSLGKLGMQMPDRAAAVADRLSHALTQASHPRASMEAREILAALEAVVPNLRPEERAGVMAAATPLRGHPNLQVRERAGRLAKRLAA